MTDRIGELPEPTGKQAQEVRTRLLGALNSARRGGDATSARTIRETLKTAWNYTDATSLIADLGDLLS